MSRIVEIGVRYRHEDLDAFKAEDKELLEHYDQMSDKLRKVAQQTGQGFAALAGGMTAAAASANDTVVRNTASAHEKIRSEHKKTGEAAKNAIGDTVKAAAVHLRSFTDLQAEWSQKSTTALVAQIQKNIQLINDERRQRLEATEAGDKAAAAAHGRRLAEIQLEQNALRAFAADREDVKYFGAGASVGILGVGRNNASLEEMRGLLGKLTKEQTAYEATRVAQEKIASAAITRIGAIQLAEQKGQISQAVAAKEIAEAKQIEVKAEAVAKEAALDKEVTANFMHEVEKRVVAKEAEEKAESAAVGKRAGGEILNKVGLGEFSQIGGSLGDLKVGGAGAALAAGAAVVAAAGMAIEAFRKGREAAESLEKAEDQVSVALARSRMPMELQVQEVERLKVKAGELADTFAMDRDEVMGVQGEIAAMSGTAGTQLDRLTEISIGVGKATGIAATEVAKIIAKGTDPENKASMQRWGLALDKSLTSQQRLNIVEHEWGRFVDEAKEKMKGGTHELDRMEFAVKRVKEENAAKIFQELGPEIAKATPYVVAFAETFGQALVKGVHLGVIAIEDAIRIAEKATNWVIGAYNTVTKALHLSNGNANAIGVGAFGPLAPELLAGEKFVSKFEENLTKIKQGKDEALSAADVDQWLKNHPRTENDGSNGNKKTIEQINKEHSDKMREVVDAAEADRLAKLNVARNQEKLTEAQFRVQELQAENVYQQQLSELMVNSNGKVIQGLEKDYHDAQRVIMVNNSAILKAQRDDEKLYEQTYFQTVSDLYSNHFTELNEEVDRKLAAGTIDQEEADKERYQNDKKSLEERMALTEFFFGRESTEYTQLYRQLESLENQYFTKSISNSRQAALKRDQMIADLTKRQIEATEDGFRKEYDLEELRYKRELDLLRQQIKNKDDLRRNEQVAEEEHQANLTRIQEKEFDERVGLTEAFNAAASVANKRLFDYVNQGLNAENSILGAFTASIVRHFIEMGEKELAQAALHAAVGKTMQAAATATTVSSMSAIAAAAEPAAAAVSIATFGAADAAAAAGITMVDTLAKGLWSSGASAFAEGGIVKGPGGPKDDRIPAMLSNGEAVLNAEAVKKLGHKFVTEANNGKIRFAATGIARVMTNVDGGEPDTYDSSAVDDEAMHSIMRSGAEAQAETEASKSKRGRATARRRHTERIHAIQEQGEQKIQQAKVENVLTSLRMRQEKDNDVAAAGKYSTASAKNAALDATAIGHFLGGGDDASLKSIIGQYLSESKAGPGAATENIVGAGGSIRDAMSQSLARNMLSTLIRIPQYAGGFALGGGSGEALAGRWFASTLAKEVASWTGSTIANTGSSLANQAVLSKGVYNPEAADMVDTTGDIFTSMFGPGKEIIAALNERIEKGIFKRSVEESEHFAETKAIGLGERGLGSALKEGGKEAFKFGAGQTVSRATAPADEAVSDSGETPRPARYNESSVLWPTPEYNGGQLTAGAISHEEMAPPVEKVKETSKETSSLAANAKKAADAFKSGKQSLDLLTKGGSKDVGTLAQSMLGLGKTVLGIFAPEALPGLDLISSIIPGFADGDYTGSGDPTQVAGVAHKNEYIFDHRSVGRIGVGPLRALRAGNPYPVMRALGVEQPSLTGFAPSFGFGGGGTSTGVSAQLSAIVDSVERVVSAVQNKEMGISSGAIFAANSQVGSVYSRKNYTAYAG